MDFKFFRGKEIDNRLLFYPVPTLNVNNVEFCFQFDDDDPTVFGMGPNDLHIHISPTTHGSIEFTGNNKKFKIFARERE